MYWIVYLGRKQCFAKEKYWNDFEKNSRTFPNQQYYVFFIKKYSINFLSRLIELQFSINIVM